MSADFKFRKKIKKREIPVGSMEFPVAPAFQNKRKPIGDDDKRSGRHVLIVGQQQERRVVEMLPARKIKSKCPSLTTYPPDYLKSFLEGRGSSSSFLLLGVRVQRKPKKKRAAAGAANHKMRPHHKFPTQDLRLEKNFN